MRVIRYLLTALLSIALISIVGFLLAREGLIFLGAKRLEDSLKVLRLYAQRDTARSECQALSGEVESGDTGINYQLRFISSQDYILEAVCPLTQSNPIELSTNILPQYVTKVPGRSGFIWSNEEASGIEIEVFRSIASAINSYVSSIQENWLVRSRKVMLQNGDINISAEVLPTSSGPTTSCEGYGYTCCDDITQTGNGDQLMGLGACPDSCFEQCISRPVLLSFNSNPFFDLKTRTVIVGTKKPLELTFVASERNKIDLSALIEFGDGEIEVVNGSEGSVMHTYNCETQLCTYTAQITITDENGVQSMKTPVSRLTIQVHGK